MLVRNVGLKGPTNWRIDGDLSLISSETARTTLYPFTMCSRRTEVAGQGYIVTCSFPLEDLLCKDRKCGVSIVSQSVFEKSFKKKVKVDKCDIKLKPHTRDDTRNR